MNMRIPWRAWYGDDWLELSFPESWSVQTLCPADAPDIGAEGIEAALDSPIGAPPLEELARGKRWVSIAVEDISRPTPVSRLMPPIMATLERAGMDLDRVRVVMAIGTHRQMTRDDIFRKIGRIAAERLDVHNNSPYGNTVDLGVSKRGTPVQVSRHFADADLRIGIGSIMPHISPGFTGGAKIVFPGVAGIESIASMHTPGRLSGRIGDVEHNELRDEIETMARDHVGLHAIINAVPNSRRGIAGLFVGDMIQAHRAGVTLARQVGATQAPAQPVDIAICNAYPKDTDFLQNATAMNVLYAAQRSVVRENGTIVCVTASPEGRGMHGLFGPGMRYDPRAGMEDARGATPMLNGVRLVYFSPYLSQADVRSRALFRSWDELLADLTSRYGEQASAAIFPCGSMQILRT
jgi:nickel-dependent lactate racemase